MSQKVLLRQQTPPSQSSTGPPASSLLHAPAVAHPAPPKSGPRKLLNESLEFQQEDATQLLSDASDFTVIGVLGGQGVGKSTIMSLLGGAPWSSEDAGDIAGSTIGLQDPAFEPTPEEAFLRAVHHTSGVDLHVSPERLVLLDTQPLMSPSIMCELMERETTLPVDVQSHENLLELHSLRVAMLLFSVCHVVVCVHDQLCDPEGLRTLRAAQMLCHGLPDVSVLARSPQAALAKLQSIVAASATDIEIDHYKNPVIGYTPRLAFVYNRMPPSAFAESQQQALRTILQKLFPRSSPLQEPSNHTDNSNTAASGAGSGAVTAGKAEGSEAAGDRCQECSDSPSGEQNGGEAEVFLLPEYEPHADGSICASHLGFRTEAENVCDQLLALHRPPFATRISEKEWFRGASRMWDLIRRSSMLADYNRTLHKLHLFT